MRGLEVIIEEKVPEDYEAQLERGSYAAKLAG